MLKVLSLLMVSVWCITSAEVPLVKNGVPGARILLEENPTRSAQLGAFELRDMIHRITNVSLPIEYGEKKANSSTLIPIRIGFAADCTDDLAGESFLISVATDKIILTGRDTPLSGKVVYGDCDTFPPIEYCDKPSLWAVYDFLETECSVHFYQIGDESVVLPPKSDTFVVKSGQRTFSPSMKAFRNLTLSANRFYTPNKRDAALYFLRMRCNVAYGDVNHNTYSIYFRYWGQATGKYFGDLASVFRGKKPEYFARPYRGTTGLFALGSRYPKDPDVPPQLCNSNDGPIRYFAEEATEVFAGKQVVGARFQPGRMTGRPWYYPILEDDNKSFCQCAECQAMFPQVDVRERAAYSHFDWINRIARQVAQKEPAIGIATCAYSNSLLYPDPAILKLKANVAVCMCLAIDSWYHPNIYDFQHTVYKKFVREESAERPLMIWGYLLSPAWDANKIFGYEKFFPFFCPWQIGKIFQEFSQDGIQGFKLECDTTGRFLEMYVASRIAFDASTDPARIIEQYFKSFYGEKAGKSMLAFYHASEKAAWDIGNYPAYIAAKQPRTSFMGGVIHNEEANWTLGSPERIQEQKELLTQALADAATPIEKARVQQFIDWNWRQVEEGRSDFEFRREMRKQPLPEMTIMSGDADTTLRTAPANGWYVIGGNSRPDDKPEIAATFDGTTLFIRFSENGPDAWKYRNENVWHNNFECFFASQQQAPYIQLAIAPEGSITGLRWSIHEGVTKSQDFSHAKVISNVCGESGWTTVIAIPFAELFTAEELEKNDRFFYGNVMRTRRYPGAKSLSWSMLDGSGMYASNLHRMGKWNLPEK